MDLWPLNGDPLDHQARALREAGLKPGHAFWVDAGGGKTGIALAEAVSLWRQNKIDAVLIAAPAGPHAQWITEQVPTWVKDHHIRAHNKMAPGKVEAFLRNRTKALRFFAINYEAMITPNGRRLISRIFEAWPRVFFVMDESTRLKNPKAARTTACTEVGRMATYRRVLSGTPILKGLEDLFCPYDIVKPGATGFRNWFAYRNYYCQTAPVPGARSPHAVRIVGYRHQDELHENVAPYTTRIPSSEFARQSSPTFVRVDCPMTPAQSLAYRTMSKALLADLGTKILTVENALTKTAKLMQIASGFVIDEEKVVTWLGQGKIDAVNNILDELDEPVIVFAPFIAMMDAVEESLRAREDRPVFRYRSRDDVDAWKEAGGVLVGNQSSGLGIGQNLQNAAATIYMSNSFSSEARWQSLARTDRQGQTRQVRYWDLISPETIDVGVLDVLSQRENLSLMTLEGIRAVIAGEARMAA
jgi:hypothetical protein